LPLLRGALVRLGSLFNAARTLRREDPPKTALSVQFLANCSERYPFRRIKRDRYHDQMQANLGRVDRQLNALIDITGTQKQLAENMGEEFTIQTTMIESLSDHMDCAQGGVQNATDAVGEVKMSGSTWLAWILMILLTVAMFRIWFLWH
jgi:hypothetical protein